MTPIWVLGTSFVLSCNQLRGGPGGRFEGCLNKKYHIRGTRRSVQKNIWAVVDIGGIQLRQPGARIIYRAWNTGFYLVGVSGIWSNLKWVLLYHKPLPTAKPFCFGIWRELKQCHSVAPKSKESVTIKADGQQKETRVLASAKRFINTLFEISNKFLSELRCRERPCNWKHPSTVKSPPFLQPGKWFPALSSHGIASNDIAAARLLDIRDAQIFEFMGRRSCC